MAGIRNRIVAGALALAALISLAGCDDTPARTAWDAPAPKSPVLVMLVLDATNDARWPEDWEFQRVGSDGEKLCSRFWRYKFLGDKYKDKNMYVLMCEHMSTGRYQLNTLGVDAGPAIIDFDLKDDPSFRYDFKRPGVYFLGSYRYHVILPPHRIGRMHFSLEKIREPDERQAIERLLAAKESTTGYWRNELTRRLHQLGGR